MSDNKRESKYGGFGKLVTGGGISEERKAKMKNMEKENKKIKLASKLRKINEKQGK